MRRDAISLTPTHGQETPCGAFGFLYLCLTDNPALGLWSSLPGFCAGLVGLVGSDIQIFELFYAAIVPPVSGGHSERCLRLSFGLFRSLYLRVGRCTAYALPISSAWYRDIPAPLVTLSLYFLLHRVRMRRYTYASLIRWRTTW